MEFPDIDQAFVDRVVKVIEEALDGNTTLLPETNDGYFDIEQVLGWRINRVNHRFEYKVQWYPTIMPRDLLHECVQQTSDGANILSDVRSMALEGDIVVNTWENTWVQEDRLNSSDAVAAFWELYYSRRFANPSVADMNILTPSSGDIFRLTEGLVLQIGEGRIWRFGYSGEGPIDRQGKLIVELLG